jgi:hypothetical protein
VGAGRIPGALLNQRRRLLFEHIGNIAQQIKKLLQRRRIAQHAQALKRKRLLL